MRKCDSGLLCECSWFKVMPFDLTAGVIYNGARKIDGLKRLPFGSWLKTAIGALICASEAFICGLCVVFVLNKPSRPL